MIGHRNNSTFDWIIMIDRRKARFSRIDFPRSVSIKIKISRRRIFRGNTHSRRGEITVVLGSARCWQSRISFNIARTFSQFRVRFVSKIDTRNQRFRDRRKLAQFKEESRKDGNIEETTPWRCGFVVGRLTIESLSLCASIFNRSVVCRSTFL